MHQPIRLSLPAVAVGALVLLAGFVGGVRALKAAGPAVTTDSRAVPLLTETLAAVDRRELAKIPRNARLLVRVADPLTPRMDGPVYSLSANGGVERAGGLSCKRIHMGSTGPGLCMALSSDETTYEGIVFDRRYRPFLRFPVSGVPDRVRVSPDGRYGVFTVFARGSREGYFADLARFSTNTQIMDLQSGRSVLRLTDQLMVTRDGRSFAPEDVQYWGVTFTDGDRFYATMATGFSRYLIEGNVRSRRARVVAQRVECPSISPDGTRIAYKRRIRYTEHWRLWVLDLRDGRNIRLAETRSIDDQLEWWGDDRILYSDDRNLFMVLADGSGDVEQVARRATSPAFVAGIDHR